jgi:hypothetical protein
MLYGKWGYPKDPKNPAGEAQDCHCESIPVSDCDQCSQQKLLCFVLYGKWGYPKDPKNPAGGAQLCHCEGMPVSDCD